MSAGTPCPALGQWNASNPYAARPAKPSWTESITSGAKRGWDGLTRPFAAQPSEDPTSDPTALRSQGRPSPRLHVEVARLNEHAGRLDEAERHYQTALAMDRNDLGALLNYARLKDRQGQPGEAFELCRRAVETHPREASVYNYLGLHYDRRKMPSEAAASFAYAVQLKPDEPLYRNNLAHVLVQLGDLRGAYEHLHAVHGEAVAYYNLGYLLHQRGDRDGAVQHLSAALRRNPNLAPAQQLLAQLAPNLRVPANDPSVPHVATVPPPGMRAHPPSGMRGPQAPSGAAPHGQPGGPPSHHAAPHMPPGAYPPAASGSIRPPQFSAPHHAPAGAPPAATGREPVLREGFPQGPSYVEPPGRGGPLMPHRSSKDLKQPNRIAAEEARLNAPYIQLTGVTSAIIPVETGEVAAQP